MTTPGTAELAVRALRDLRDSWRPLLAAYVAYKLATFALLSSLAGLTLQAFLALSGRSSVADEDILFFALSPVGALGLLAAATVAVAVVALEQACLMTILSAARRGEHVGLLQALVASGRSALPVLRVTAALIVQTLLWTAPFLALAAWIGARMLGEYDINYYLSERPPVFQRAAWLVGVVLAAMLLVLVPRALGWVQALPLALFEGLAGRRALAVSRERGSGRGTALLLVTWALASLAASGAVSVVVRAVAALGVTGLGQRTGLLVVFLGALVIAWVLATLTVGAASTASFSALTLRLYAGSDHAEKVATRDEATAVRGLSWTTRRILTALVAAAAASAAVGGAMLADIDAGDRDVLVIAHRGASRAAPENTLAAVRRAIDDGAHQVEVDVQRTVDDAVVVTHDRDLMRVAGVALQVRTATLSELRAVDIAGERVPTLVEVLDACRGRAGVTIELKYYGADAQLAERTVAVVDEAGEGVAVEYMSLDASAVAQLAELRPGARRGLLTAAKMGKLADVDADFLAVQQKIATPAFLNLAHARGKDVYVWTVNDRVEMARAIMRGVDGLITDEPALARDALARWAELNDVEHLLLRLALWFGVEPPPPHGGASR
jgi:glycerophosphoryl diester phosphodiesterase